MSEEELPDELKKLIIAQRIPPHNLKFEDNHIPISFNPFYRYGDGDDVSDYPNYKFKLQKRQHRCRRCHFRRRSENFDESKILADTTGVIEVLSERSAFGVHRQHLKKSAGSGIRKNLLREPLLRTLQSCQQKSSSYNIITTTTYGQKIHEVEHTDDQLLQNTVDFQDLIAECHILLEKNTPKKLQTPNSLPCESNKTTITNVTFSSLGSITTSISYPSCEAHIATRASTCSQQAGSGGVNVSDDVTIDELASYFDTLVHIPKKMSSMAEMMYT